MSKIYFIFLSVIIVCNLSYSQDIVGKIHTNTEANTLFGAVLTSVPISSDDLNNLASQTKYYLMFRILNGNLTILGDKRVVLYPTDTVISPIDVFKYFSISLIQKLLTDGKTSMSSIEIRKDGILTVTSGIYTLEESAECPPWCW